MMINCPKCGFFQPEDRYCASCGIDMDSFKPALKSWRSRLTGSSGFYFFLFGVIIISTIYFIYQQKQLVQPETLEVARQTQPIQREARRAEPAPQKAQTPVPRSAPPPLGSTKEVGQSASKIAKRAAETRGTIAKTPTQPKIKITYLEVPQEQFTVLLENATGDDQSGIIPDFAAKIKQITGSENRYAPPATRLGSESPKNVPDSLEPIVLYKGTFDTRINSDIGLMIQIIPTSMDEMGLHTEIRVRRTVTDISGAEPVADTQTFNGDFSIPVGAAAYFAGVFPHRSVDEGEQRYFSSGILRVLNSAEFMANSSEFFVFFELQGSPGTR